MAAPSTPSPPIGSLKALEDSGSCGQRAGWVPRHLVAKWEGRVVAVMPLYAKGHSQGEYVFDHNWAHAWERAGGEYYPKLQGAVPFTPATGRRFLTAPDAPEGADIALMEGMRRLTDNNGLSSAHVTFCTREPNGSGAARLACCNARISSFTGWMTATPISTLSSPRSPAANANRSARSARAPFANGIEIIHLTGDDLQPEHWDAFWGFYQDTGMRKWGSPYLTREFFDIAQERLRDDILLIMCRREGRWIAGALNVIGRDTLFGRYWGCSEDHPFLHFETCYYQAIDAALSLGLNRVEAGAQGAHKLARGYLPTPTYSLHYISDERFRAAVGDYLERERAAVDEEIEFLLTRAPFRKGESQNG